MPTRPGFPGFPSEALDFFRKLERNNRREWFQPRKAEFEEHVRKPMLQLVEAVNLEMARFAPDHVTEPASAVYRIYRDTRFSPDKSPYKTHIAANFPRRGFEKHGSGGYYFAISHKEVAIGGGIYMPGPEQLLAIRTHIAGNHGRFRALSLNRNLIGLLGPLQGDSLSRVPKGFCAEHPAADLLRMKQWLYYVTLDPELAVEPSVLNEIVTRFRAMRPVVDFLNEPLLKKKTKLALADLIS